mmetsp:Transcript_15214/g.35071  ORF Transcript_15214/g.35071 Transcript_15214/m.35071 type:complete len:265 (-) Transcript_15214:327-1121(-)
MVRRAGEVAGFERRVVRRRRIILIDLIGSVVSGGFSRSRAHIIPHGVGGSGDFHSHEWIEERRVVGRWIQREILEELVAVAALVVVVRKGKDHAVGGGIPPVPGAQPVVDHDAPGSVKGLGGVGLALEGALAAGHQENGGLVLVPVGLRMGGHGDDADAGLAGGRIHVHRGIEALAEVRIVVGGPNERAFQVVGLASERSPLDQELEGIVVVHHRQDVGFRQRRGRDAEHDVRERCPNEHEHQNRAGRTPGQPEQEQQEQQEHR